MIILSARAIWSQNFQSTLHTSVPPFLSYFVFNASLLVSLPIYHRPALLRAGRLVALIVKSLLLGTSSLHLEGCSSQHLNQQNKPENGSFFSHLRWPLLRPHGRALTHGTRRALRLWRWIAPPASMGSPARRAECGEPGRVWSGIGER